MIQTVQHCLCLILMISIVGCNNTNPFIRSLGIDAGLVSDLEFSESASLSTLATADQNYTSIIPDDLGQYTSYRRFIRLSGVCALQMDTMAIVKEDDSFANLTLSNVVDEPAFQAAIAEQGYYLLNLCATSQTFQLFVDTQSSSSLSAYELFSLSSWAHEGQQPKLINWNFRSQISQVKELSYLQVVVLSRFGPPPVVPELRMVKRITGIRGVTGKAELGNANAVADGLADEILNNYMNSVAKTFAVINPVTSPVLVPAGFVYKYKIELLKFIDEGVIGLGLQGSSNTHPAKANLACSVGVFESKDDQSIPELDLGSSQFACKDGSHTIHMTRSYNYQIVITETSDQDPMLLNKMRYNFRVNAAPLFFENEVTFDEAHNASVSNPVKDTVAYTETLTLSKLLPAVPLGSTPLTVFKINLASDKALEQEKQDGLFLPHVVLGGLLKDTDLDLRDRYESLSEFRVKIRPFAESHLLTISCEVAAESPTVTGCRQLVIKSKSNALTTTVDVVVVDKHGAESKKTIRIPIQVVNRHNCLVKDSDGHPELSICN